MNFIDDACSRYILKATKKAPVITDAFLVEHLEKSSPLIEEEIRRWRYLLWVDWVEHQRVEERRKKLVVP
jgi:hypothetical protein